MDKIFIRNLSIDTFIGIYSHELKSKQEIILDLELQTNCQTAAAGDNIGDTNNYAHIVEIIQAICQQKQFKLIETLAECICSNLLNTFKTNWVKLSITKPEALEQCREVGITIERSKT